MVHWRQDCPATSTPLSRIGHPLPPISSSWRYSLPFETYVSSVTRPLVVAGELRFVVPADERLYSLIIPLALGTEDTRIRVQLLAAVDIRHEGGGKEYVIGYHQTFFMTSDRPVRATRYSWPDESQQRGISGSMLEYDMDPRLSQKRTYFDEYNLQIVVTSHYLFEVRIIKLHPMY